MHTSLIIKRMYMTVQSGNVAISIMDESEPSWLKPQLELKDFHFGSARDLFPFSSKSKIGRKRAEILILIFLIFLYVAK